MNQNRRLCLTRRIASGVAARSLGVFLAAGAPVQVLAASPQFAYSTEKWASLQDDKLEFDEIADRIHEYNSTVEKNRIGYKDYQGKDSNEIAQEYYDAADEIESSIEYPDSDDANYGSALAAAQRSEASATQMREQGDNNVDDANVKAWGYTQTEKSLVQQAQNLMIQYWNAQENLKSVQNQVSKAEKDYETANLKLSSGSATQTDVLDAKETLLKAQASITTAEKMITIGNDEASISELLALNDSVLESVYPTKTQDAGTVVRFTYETEKRVAPAVKTARPKALIPVFPGTNCEYDTQRALLEAGADAEQFIIRNLTSADVADSVERFAKAVKDSQIIVIPGGFSGGDEPDGSAKLITAFFRNAAVKEQVTDLLEKRDGLMLGVCNGFQALIKLGLVPYGKIMDTDADFPTLTYNVIGRHQSRLVRTRVCSNKSPWLAGTKVGDIYTVPISHGEGRFLASEELVKKLAENGQIATQYVDLDGYATIDAAFNPNGSICAIEGITSPDGRVFGKMGHTERIGKELYRNVPGQYEMELFTSAVRYFK